MRLLSAVTTERRTPDWSLMVDEMSPLQHEKLATMFSNEFKPVLQKWCEAYKGHVKIRPEDVRLDQCKQRLGVEERRCLYSFVSDDGNTLTFAECDGTARIFYYMSKSGANSLNSLPASGTVPKLSVPVTREEVVQMAKADTGIQFAPKDILIRPTGAACSLEGGAFVSVGGKPDQWDITNVSLVIGPDSMIINYQGPAY